MEKTLVVSLLVVAACSGDTGPGPRDEPMASVIFSRQLPAPGDRSGEAEYLSNRTETANYPQAEFGYTGYPYRPGHATRTHSCGHIRGVPRALRSGAVMRPSGLSPFYQKYTEAYGIPVLGSSRVTDAALQRACYVLRFSLADRRDVREAFYRMGGHVSVIARSERTTQIPEFSNLDPGYWDKRARGLGATVDNPISSCAEENLLCDGYPRDRWYNEDIFLHELAHAVDNIGASIGVPGWESRARAAFQSARARGLWTNTYANTNPDEYYAEGVDMYFDVQAESVPGDGIHNWVNTRPELRSHDPGLYSIVHELYPCRNTFIKRCRKDREAELNQVLKMDCHGHDHVTSGSTKPHHGHHHHKVTSPKPHHRLTTSSPHHGHSTACVDTSNVCRTWAAYGHCKINPGYMLVSCRKSCHVCGGDKTDPETCRDSDERCPSWASHGQCAVNPKYMLPHCQRSCGTCDVSAVIGR